MKRRTFLSGLTSLGILPNIPLPALATAPASTAALESVKAAEIIVRAHNSCSIPMLQRLLRVEAAIAQEVQGLLIKRGAITVPSVAGVSQAVNPSNLDVFLPGSSAQSGLDAKIKEAVKDKVKQYLTGDDSASDPSDEPEQSAEGRQDGIPSSHT